MNVPEHSFSFSEMPLRCPNALIACLSRLACGLAIALGVVALSTDVAQAADCMDRFPQGRFGILSSHPAVAKLALEGFSPLYLMKQLLTICRPGSCLYVYTGAVFRMV